MSGVEKHVYRFGEGAVEGNGSMRDLLGGKGAGLAEMTRLQVSVPPGFTLTTAVYRYWSEHARYPGGLEREMDAALGWLEDVAGRRLNDPTDPLLVSVRSGAPVSMPGMMDTVLNVGITDRCLDGLSSKSGSRRFALDSYRRLIQMYGAVVLGVPRQMFDRALDDVKQSMKQPREKTSGKCELERIVQAFKAAVLEHTGRPFPQDPQEQLAMAIDAVFRSWRSDRAECYRKLNGISESMGTAVTVQAMVFGNRGGKSGTGVGFTRNPSTGANEIFGEFLPDVQGEDIVAGVKTPMPIAEMANAMPDVYRELAVIARRLEDHFREAQDFEFTVEEEKLFLLQTRTAKRSGLATVRTAVEMAAEGTISRLEALRRVRPENISEAISSKLDMSDGASVLLTQGTAASPGVAVGQIALTAEEAVARANRGETVILVTKETTADDIQGMAVSAGFLTACGGSTSHAAVVARGMGKCCITGAKQILMDERVPGIRIGGKLFHSGDWLSLDGATGRVFEGQLPTLPADQENPFLDALLGWARNASSSSVRANADTPQDAIAARKAGAAGIGLCRTEHMFFAPDRLEHMRSMILAESVEERAEALDLLLPMQQRDFEGLFRAMSPLPVTIRLLDPPLHEFLPTAEKIDYEIAAAIREENLDYAGRLKNVRRRIEALAEVNPMMGHRGCRLSLSYPEILRMQVRAVLQAAATVAAEGHDPHPEIMVPLVATEGEMQALAQMIEAAAAETLRDCEQAIPFRIGAMIELPRAAVCACGIAKYVSFLSFGTNDLTQMTYGFSRDDARTYLEGYLQNGILKADPFRTIDREGVGRLMEMAVQSVRAACPDVKIGVCGEHGGDPESIRFFRSLGIDYVSCSPARLAVAQLAMAQAEMKADCEFTFEKLTAV